MSKSALNTVISRRGWLGQLAAAALVAASAGSSLVAAPAQAAGRWEYIGTYDGVRVERKEIPGSDVFAFRGEITTNMHIGKIIATFLDRDKRKAWVDRYEKSKTLAKPGEMEEIYWIAFSLPFPVSNRDYVLHAVAVPEPDKGVFTANIKSVKHPSAPENDDYVRATANGTFYRFEAVKGQERTKLYVEVHTDPKGMLPDTLVNLIQKKWPSKTLSGLIKASRNAPIPDAYAKWHE